MNLLMGKKSKQYYQIISKLVQVWGKFSKIPNNIEMKERKNKITIDRKNLQ